MKVFDRMGRTIGRLALSVAIGGLPEDAVARNAAGTRRWSEVITAAKLKAE